MPKVLMYYSHGNKIGGPLTYINTVIESPLKEKYEFVTCYQNQAPGGWDGKMLKRMVEQIKQEKPDIVHVHGAQSEGFYGVLAAKKAGCKHVVMTVHGFAFDDSACKGMKHFLYKHIVEPFSLRHAEQVYCVCKFAADRKIVKKNCKKRLYGYIHNPVPQLCITEDRQSVRTRLGITEQDTVFAISGRLVYDKGFSVLADAVKIANRSTDVPFKLLVIGDGVYRNTFSQLMQEEIDAGQVILVGHTNRVADYLNAADAYVFPSFHENLSIAILEACASRLPCIVSNVGGNGEIVTDGENGFVIDGFAAKDYAEKMRYLLKNKDAMHTMGENAKRIADTKFSLETMCQKIDEVYRNALANSQYKHEN